MSQAIVYDRPRAESSINCIGTKDSVREDVKTELRSDCTRPGVYIERACMHACVRPAIFGLHCRVVNVKELVLKVRHDAALR